MDIIFLAAIAIFIFFRLKDQLGKISDEEKNSILKNIKSQKQRIANLQKKNRGPSLKIVPQEEDSKEQEKTPDQACTQNLNENSISTLAQILNKFDISAEFFITGAKSAFEMTLESFAKNDTKMLEILLGEKLYEGFKKSVEKRKKEERTLHTQIISIEDAQITFAAIRDDKALITVQFLSKQINYLTSKENEIVQGSKEQINDLKDTWIFKKDLNDTSPNWKVSTTS